MEVEEVDGNTVWATRAYVRGMEEWENRAFTVRWCIFVNMDEEDRWYHVLFLLPGFYESEEKARQVIQEKYAKIATPNNYGGCKCTFCSVNHLLAMTCMGLKYDE